MRGWWKIQFHRGYEGDGYILFQDGHLVRIYMADGTPIDNRIVEYTTVNSKATPPEWAND